MQTRILTAQTMLLIVLSGAHLVSGSEADSQADECRIIVANNVNKSNPVIIRGISRRLTDESRYCSYLAIPYAWPPINAYRFQPPMLYPLEQIDTNRTFTHEPNWCLQAIILYANRLLVGTEDCLYLNVFMSGRISQKLSVNASDEAIRLHPVVVWIHGGSFNYGSASAWSERFAHFIDQDIIVVTINYRLGPIGFLHAPDLNITGNNGLHDQQMALKWLQKYGTHFGGNPNAVTLMGWSAGSASVAYHLYANSSRNLFHRAILMSGTMMSQWAFDPQPNYCASLVLDKVRRSQRSLKALGMTLHQVLQSIDKTNLFPLYEDTISKVTFGIPQDCFVPTIDNELIAALPHRMIESRPVVNVPLLIGGVAIELNVNDVSVPASFRCEHVRYPNENSTLLSLIIEYLNGKCEFFNESGALNEKRRDMYMHFLSEIEMLHGIDEFSNSYARFTGNAKNMFVYQYSYGPNMKHGDDVQHILPKWPRDDSLEYSLISTRMQTMWLNFIREGHPTPIAEAADAHTTINWLPFQMDQQRYLNIDVTFSMKQRDPGAPHIKLWKSIYDCLYRFECDRINSYLNGSIACHN